MNNINPWILLCGVCCLWPVIIGVIPTWIYMRYRPRFRSPVSFQDESKKRPGPAYRS